jgi:hypothetical protein
MHAMKDPKQSIVFNRLLAKAEFCDTPSTSLTFEVASSIAWGPKAQKIIRSKKTCMICALHYFFCQIFVLHFVAKHRQCKQ